MTYPTDPKKMTPKEAIHQALACHRSMIACGEKPNEDTDALFAAAMAAVKSLDGTAIEAMQAVDVINGDLESHYNDLGYDDARMDMDDPRSNQEPTPHLTFSYVGTWSGVEFDGWSIWDTETDDRWDENDNQIPLEPYFRKQIAARLKVMREMPF